MGGIVWGMFGVGKITFKKFKILGAGAAPEKIFGRRSYFGVKNV